jgi:hypothetical protein
MSTPTEVHLAWSRRLLKQDEDADQRLPASMELAYDRLLRCAGPIIGNNGVRAILARSLKLAAANHPALRPVLLVDGWAADPAKALRECPQADDDTARAGAIAVLAIFLSLLSHFIGERLTTQIIETAWKPSEETKK